MKELLMQEIARRKQQGQAEVSLAFIKETLCKLGYTLNRNNDCRSMARYMSGELAGTTYPALTTGIDEISSGLSFAHVDARRDANFYALQELRFSQPFFAVVNGYILDL